MGCAPADEIARGVERAGGGESRGVERGGTERLLHCSENPDTQERIPVAFLTCSPVLKPDPALCFPRETRKLQLLP